MIPDWMKTIGNLGPLLLIVSVGVIIFGIVRLMTFVGSKNEEREEEERKRKEFIKKMNAKIPNEKLMS